MKSKPQVGHLISLKEEIFINNLKEVKKAFDNYKVNIILDGGTLLGAYRDKKFIEWDDDIDFVMWMKDLDKAKLACKELKGYHIDINTGNYCPDINLYKDGCPIGISLYTDIQGNVIRKRIEPRHFIGQSLNYLHWVLNLYDAKSKKGRTSPEITEKIVELCQLIPNGIREKLVKIVWSIYEKIDTTHIEHIIPSHFFINLSELEFYGMKFKVPKDTEGYLKFRYGDNWKTPIKSERCYLMGDMTQ